MALRRPPVWLRPGNAPFAVVAIGASVGGLGALRTIFSDLPADFGGAIMVAHHRGLTSTESYLSYLGLLQGRTSLRVIEAAHGEKLRGGVVYVAPLGRHIEVCRDGTVYTDRSERLATVRPSIDLLFETVAACYGDRAIGVVLSGTGRDGAEGVQAIRGRGGFVIAQDRGSSTEFGMPCSAIETRRVDLVLPLRHIGFALRTLFGGDNEVGREQHVIHSTN